MLKNLQPFMEADGAGTGAQTNTEEPAQQHDNNAESQHENADGQKTGDDVRSEAQKIADAMVAKKLKGMPSKEEMAAFKKWQEDQKTEAQRIADTQQRANEAIAEAEKREAKANAMIAAAKTGLKPEFISDAVILAMARADDGASIEEAMETIAKNNPSWRVGGADLPKGGSNPATEASGELLKIKRYF